MKNSIKKFCGSLRESSRLKKDDSNIDMRNLTWGYILTYNSNNYRVNFLQAKNNKMTIPVTIALGKQV